jgi:hypothetical protein
MEPQNLSLLRASDSDRQKIADVIADAYADGRLTVEEHSQRLDAVWAAKTLGELEPLVVDLGRPLSRPQSSSIKWPGSTGAANRTANTATNGGNLPAVVDDNERAFAIMSTSKREGEWVVPPHMTMLGVMGSAEWDMRDAIFTAPTIVVDVALTMGSMTLRIPDGVGVEDKTMHILSETQFKGVVPAQPGAPVIVLQGFMAMGSVVIKGSGDKPLIERLGFKSG